MRMRLFQTLRLWRHEVRPTLALALPIMAGMLSQMLMGLADTIMVGRVGVVPLAAASFVNSVAHLPLVFGLGLLSCIAVLTAQAYGAKQPRVAGEVLRHGLVLAAATGFLAMLSLCALYPMLPWFGQTPEVTRAAGSYLLIFGVSILPALLAHGGKQFSDALNHPWWPTMIMFGSVLLNIFLNWVLIYGHWGAPAMGLVGAGWATLTARTVMAAVMMVYVLQAPRMRAFHPSLWCAALNGAQFRSLFKVGWPVGVQHFFEVSAFAFGAIMLGWLSAEAIAAHQIAISCAAMTFMAALGIGAAACIRVGHAYGARQFQRTRRIGFSAVGISATLMAVFGVIFALAGKPIAGLFIDSPAVVALTAQLLVVAAVFQIADGIQVTSISALRGLADVRVPAVIAVVAYWCVALPVGTLLTFRTHLGAAGMWMGFAAGLGAAALGLTWRFHRQTRPGVVREITRPLGPETFPEHGALP